MSRETFEMWQVSLQRIYKVIKSNWVHKNDTVDLYVDIIDSLDKLDLLLKESLGK